MQQQQRVGELVHAMGEELVRDGRRRVVVFQCVFQSQAVDDIDGADDETMGGGFYDSIKNIPVRACDGGRVVVGK